MRRTIFLVAMATALAVAACTGGGDDDDDAASPSPSPSASGSPSPSPSPTAFAADRCWLTWKTLRPEGTTDAILVDLPASLWLAGGTVTYDTPGVTANFLYDSDGTFAGSGAIGIPGGGAFEISADGFVPGALVTFSDADAQDFTRYDPMVGSTTGEIVASGGIGSFTGTWTDPLETDPGSFLEGEGTLAITISGSSLTLGATRAVGQCYQVDSL